MEFLINGVIKYNEPGVFIAFEETPEELAKNVASLGFDLVELQRKKKIAIDHIHLDPIEIEETGDYNLDGLFIRIAAAVQSVGAKRIVVDTLEALFSIIPNETILRAELRRLFQWFKAQHLTAIVTGEKGTNSSLTRYGLEEYVADCVIVLDHRIVDQLSTRRLRIVKYRGSLHGTNEYPFLIDQTGIFIQPLSSVGLQYQASGEKISTGIPHLDDMLKGGDTMLEALF